MTRNKLIVERYMDAYRKLDHAEILDCLTDDVEWLVPGAFHSHGKQAFDGHIENDCFKGAPEIVVDRLTEEDDVVVAEGSVKSLMTSGEMFEALYCDVFEMRDGKIAKLTSFLATMSEDAGAS